MGGWEEGQLHSREGTGPAPWGSPSPGGTLGLCWQRELSPGTGERSTPRASPALLGHSYHPEPPWREFVKELRCGRPPGKQPKLGAEGKQRWFCATSSAPGNVCSATSGEISCKLSLPPPAPAPGSPTEAILPARTPGKNPAADWYCKATNSKHCACARCHGVPCSAAGPTAHPRAHPRACPRGSSLQPRATSPASAAQGRAAKTL